MLTYAIGFLEVAGYSVALAAMDQACKTADITIVGIDTINPKDTSFPLPLTVQTKFIGPLSDVKEAVAVAKKVALQYNQEIEVTASVMEGPYDQIAYLAQITKIK